MARGWRNELWTSERVGELTKRLFHVVYSPDHVRKLLREKLHWTSQKPERRGRERDEEEIERWQKEELPRIKNVQKRGAHLVFLVEPGFMLTPTARRTHAPRGGTPIQKHWARHGRISVKSIVTVSPQHQRLGFIS